MFEVRKPKQKPVVVIRAASYSELAEYERRKPNCIGESLFTPIAGIQRIEPLNTESKATLCNMVFEREVTFESSAQDDLLFIKCGRL
jgi:hypothetical protein